MATATSGYLTFVTNPQQWKCWIIFSWCNTSEDNYTQRTDFCPTRAWHSFFFSRLSDFGGPSFPAKCQETMAPRSLLNALDIDSRDYLLTVNLPLSFQHLLFFLFFFIRHTTLPYISPFRVCATLFFRSLCVDGASGKKTQEYEKTVIDFI